MDLWLRCISNVVLLLGVKANCNPTPHDLLGSEWSDKFGIERGTNNASLSLRGHAADTQSSKYDLGIRMSFAPGPFCRTRIISLDSWFHLTNRTDAALDVRQVGQHHWFKLQPRETRVFNWLRSHAGESHSGDGVDQSASEERICIRWAGAEDTDPQPAQFKQAPFRQLDGEWTVPFGISEIRETLVEMRGDMAEVSSMLSLIHRNKHCIVSC